MKLWICGDLLSTCGKRTTLRLSNNNLMKYTPLIVVHSVCLLFIYCGCCWCWYCWLCCFIFLSISLSKEWDHILTIYYDQFVELREIMKNKTVFWSKILDENFQFKINVMTCELHKYYHILFSIWVWEYFELCTINSEYSVFRKKAKNGN